MVDRGELYSPFSKAEQRASTLLKEWLTREQCIQYQRLGYFEVRGSHSGKRYRIRPARQMNVDQLDERGCRVDVLCFLPEKYVPVSDVMLAQKIMLENDEPAALGVAVRRASLDGDGATDITGWNPRRRDAVAPRSGGALD
jgi:hypothetical protein